MVKAWYHKVMLQIILCCVDHGVRWFHYIWYCGSTTVKLWYQMLTPRYFNIYHNVQKLYNTTIFCKFVFHFEFTKTYCDMVL